MTPLARALLALGLCAAPASMPFLPPRQDEGLAAGERLGLDAREVRRLLQHSPLSEPPPDETNAWADDPGAAQLGQRLFFDTRLSQDGSQSCATCHDPEQGFADGRELAQGLGDLERHTPSLWNAAWQRWYFWDGRVDTLWGQAFQPLESPLEMGSSRTALARLIATSAELRGPYERVFGALPAALDAERLPEHARPVAGDDHHPHARAWAQLTEARRAAVERVAVNAAKAIAAYERRLVSRRSPFDVFVEGLREDDGEKLAALSPAALAGARLFVGKAGCRMCHSGPTFSDGEFHDIGIPPLGGGRPADPGRFEGLGALLAEPFNSASAHSDDRSGPRASALAHLARGPQTWGEFKTPTLRNVALSPPYMHQGQKADLDAVLHYYSTLEGLVPSGHHQQSVLTPLMFEPAELDALRAFLESLTDTGVDASWLSPPE